MLAAVAASHILPLLILRTFQQIGIGPANPTSDALGGLGFRAHLFYSHHIQFMAISYPYISSVSSIATAVNQLRKNFPAVVDAEWLKKQALAPNNESYLLGVLRFVKIIDKDGKRVEEAKKVFAHQDAEFKTEFEAFVKEAYQDLFSIHGDEAWSSPKLLTYFRHASGSSEVVGGRQVRTFKTLAALCGHGEVKEPTEQRKKAPSSTTTAKKKTVSVAPPSTSHSNNHSPVSSPPAVTVGTSGHLPFGLGVRVEVILPAGADQATYDSIFRSIRTNLIDASSSAPI